MAQRLPDSPCRTMTSQANENNMCMTRDKRNASDFIVRARWTVMPVCEQTEGGKKHNGKKNYKQYDSGLKKRH